MIKNQLPNNWINAILVDLLEYIQPTKYIVNSTDYDDTYETPVLTPGKTFIKGYTNEKEGIFDNLPTIIFDDFTTASRFVNFPFKVKSSAMKILIPTSSLVNLKYTFLFMQTIKFRSSTHKRYWISEYSKLPIPLPPLNEQHRIVEKIEELFTKLDAAVAELKNVKKQLKRYRQSVLKAAFEGKLTEDESKWESKTLENICLKIQDGSHYSPKILYDTKKNGMYKYITSKNIRNNFMILENVKYVDKEYHLTIYPRCNPEYGDVLLTKDGANTGNVTLNILDEEFSLLSSVCLIKTSKDKLNSSFLKYYIQSPIGKRAILGDMTGTAIKRIILKKIKGTKISIPNIAEQQTIVEEIEARFSVADKIEEEIDLNLKKTEQLRQSILKKAFEGKLVPQDPNDEPASELLEKIKKEREKKKA